MPYSPAAIHQWCAIPADELEAHPDRRLDVRIVADSVAMGELMALELVAEIQEAREESRLLRAIIPCGPGSWYEPFTRLVKETETSLEHVVVYHMDECLDWQGRPVPYSHPYSFRGFMQRHFYDPIPGELGVKVENRRWLDPHSMYDIEDELDAQPADLVYGGWGQDGHVAYNQARRDPFRQLTLDELRDSTVRIQQNNLDTVIALGQRVLGSAHQLVPPMSVTLGMRQILAARRIRLFSDTGPWKQTALRVGMFGEPEPEYPLTLLQGHGDVLLTATSETATHPISEHPEWDFGAEAMSAAGGAAPTGAEVERPATA